MWLLTPGGTAARPYFFQHLQQRELLLGGMGVFPHKENRGFGGFPPMPLQGINEFLGVTGTPFPAVSLRFGNCNDGLNDGLWARTLNNVAANAWWNYGASFFYQF